MGTDLVFLFVMKTYVVTSQNCLIEMILMRG